MESKDAQETNLPPKKKLSTSTILIILLAVALAFYVINQLSISSSPPAQASPADKYMNDYGGERSAYEEILSLSNCSQLQEKFDTASANNAREQAGTKNFKVTTGYMVAADDRMKEVGCYK